MRKNLGPTIQQYLRLNPDFLQDFQRMKALFVEWDRFNDITTARPSGTISSTSAPMDIGTTLNGKGTTWTSYHNNIHKGTYNYSKNYKGQNGNFNGTRRAKTTWYPPHHMLPWTNDKGTYKGA